MPTVLRSTGDSVTSPHDLTRSHDLTQQGLLEKLLKNRTPTIMANNPDQSLQHLERAKKLHAEGRLHESEAEFQKLLAAA
jgi:hypothetical protein